MRELALADALDRAHRVEPERTLARHRDQGPVGEDDIGRHPLVAGELEPELAQMLEQAGRALVEPVGAGRIALTRYTLLPLLAVFFLTNPMAYTFGRFLPEKYKPAFYDAAVSFVHPPLGIFPHVNPGELFVWAGIATGVTTGYGAGETVNLAVRYFIVGLVVIFIRGIVTQQITNILWSQRPKDAEDTEEYGAEMSETAHIGEA